MQDLRLENRILIVSQIKQYCAKRSLDYIDILETMYDTIANEGEESEHLDVIAETLKEKLKKEHARRVRKILKSRLNAGNVIQAINARAVSIIRYRLDKIRATRTGQENKEVAKHI